MRETNWTARIIAFLLVAIIFGVLVGGYIAGNPPEQHRKVVVPNDRLPG